MPARRWALIIAGFFFLFFGTVFALQGANILKGSAVMSGNSAYIYVGGVLDVVGLVLIIGGAMAGYKPTAARAEGGATQSKGSGSST